jgi:hypothetical protein
VEPRPRNNYTRCVAATHALTLPLKLEKNHLHLTRGFNTEKNASGGSQIPALAHVEVPPVAKKARVQIHLGISLQQHHKHENLHKLV